MPRPKNFTLGVIGFGKMAESLVAGALRQKALRPRDVIVLAHRPERDGELKRRHKVRFVRTLHELCDQAETLLLAVKPPQMGGVLADLRQYAENKLIITVAAGLSAGYYKKRLGRHARVIRAMPNTPARLGCGATGYFAAKGVTAHDKRICEALFHATGLVEEVKREELIDAVIAVSGSGVAFVYEYARIVAEAGAGFGLDKGVAYRFAVQTLLGAAQMLVQMGLKPEELIAQVTSKKGTTLAGLDALKREGFAAAVRAAMRAAVMRSAEIGLELERA